MAQAFPIQNRQLRQRQLAFDPSQVGSGGADVVSSILQQQLQGAQAGAPGGAGVGDTLAGAGEGFGDLINFFSPGPVQAGPTQSGAPLRGPSPASNVASKIGGK